MPQGASKALSLSITLNTLFIGVEIIFGIMAGSLALMADAGHNASDVLGLFLAWGAMLLARRHATGRFTYGLQSASILAALLNALTLFAALGGIALVAIQRLQEPHATQTGIVLWVALAGVAVNGLTAWLLHRDHHDLNMRAAFLHMVADAAISFGVAASALLTEYTGWLWLDPVVSLAIVAVIALSTWKLLRESMEMAMHAAPRHVDVAAVREFLRKQPGVTEAHDLHIWAISTSEISLSAHLVMPGGHPGDNFLLALTESLHERFSIGHATLQIELGGEVHPGHAGCDHPHPHHDHHH
ncbi:MAG: cation transporter [Proteobacteria bacterium]|nr:cation transporter [Pseudomonadota bacterium]